jgi:hypothetical protein
MRSLIVLSVDAFDCYICCLHSRNDIFLDPTTLSGVVGEISSLDKDLAVLKLFKFLLDKLEGVLIRHVGRRVGQNPCAGGLRGRHCECDCWRGLMGKER